MANTYKNIVITPNTGSTIGDPTIVFSGGDSNTNTDIILRVYPTSNGTLSFEGNAGQLFSITNDLSNTIFSVNDVSGIPLLEINVASQQITLGQFYGNVGIGTGASNVSNYKLDVIGGANISLPNLTVGGTNVSAAIVAALSANVNVLAAAVVANDASQGANIAVLAASFVSNSQTLSANVNTLAATFASANANSISQSANVNVLAAAVVANDASQGANIAVLAASFVSNSQTLSANVNVLAAATAARLPLAGGTMTGLIIGRTSAGANTSVANDGGALSVRGDTTNAAAMSFHRPSAYAINMGLDTDNIFRIGGWSDGVNTYRVQLGTPGGTHTFTGTVAATTFSGAGTSLTGTAASLTAGNATTAGGFTPSQTNGVGSRIVVADGSGYINNNYFNSTDDISSGTISYIMAKFGDNYYRSATAAKVASFLASQSFASPTFTGTGSVTGGFNVTPGNLGTISTGTTTLAASSGNYQYYTNGGAHTIAAPGSDCAIDILVTNSATAGAITLSGFTAPSGGGGDTYATTNANRYILSVRRINAISTYVWKALQ
jgi:hypothetical protein